MVMKIKWIFIFLVFFLTLSGGKEIALSHDADPPPPPAAGDLEERLEALKRSLESLSQELKQLGESDALRNLKREMERFHDELKRSGKALGHKMQEEILPRLEKEMGKFREWLKELKQGDGPETQPV
jgi:chromosome segregation ATPase